MWSKNERINKVINVLLFMIAINFIHLGQFILPIICLILFIDRKFKFKVNNVYIFIILCLFGFSFFVFTYKMGFYSVMGFTLPMAYYIGSNLNEVNENNIKKIIYIIAAGMIAHVMLNFIYEITIYGIDVMDKKTRYDFWIRDSIVPTLIGVLFTIPFGCVYYVVTYENNKKLKPLLIFGFVFLLFYDIALGRRTPLVILLLSIISSYVTILFFNKGNDVPKWPIFFVIIIVLIYLLIKAVFAWTHVYYWQLYYKLENIILLYKINNYGLDGERFGIIMAAHRLMSIYPWGGMQISNTLDIKVHEFWLDIYDYAGVIPFVLMLVYSIFNLFKQYQIFISKKISNPIKVLLMTVFVCIVAQLFIEPVMTCSTIFLLCSIIILTASHKLLG